MKRGKILFAAVLMAAVVCQGAERITSPPPGDFQIDTGTFSKPGPSGPVARISGPTTVNAGDLAVMRSDGSAGKLKWLLVPKNALDRTMEGSNGELAFASATPGTYTFILISVDGDKLAWAMHELQNGGGPGPGPTPPGPDPPGPTPPPDPPNPDDPFADLIRVSREGAAKVDTINKAEEAGKLARATKAQAAAIMAGAYSSAKEIREAWRDANHQAIGFESTGKWLPWAEAVGNAIQGLDSSGKLKEYKSYAQAFEAVAKGLEGVQ